VSRRSGTQLSHILLVEGADEAHVVRQLCKQHPSAPTVSVVEKGGIDPLLDSIGPETRPPYRQAVGILVDANTDPAGRWRAVAKELGDEGVALPPAPEPDGTVVEGEPRVGVWLMPDNQSDGELEDFVAQMIPDDDPVWPRSQCYIDRIPPAARKFTNDKAAKAQLYAWLAAREHPRLMGWAVRDGDLAVNGDLCQRFVAWLTRLLG